MWSSFDLSRDPEKFHSSTSPLGFKKTTNYKQNSACDTFGNGETCSSQLLLFLAETLPVRARCSPPSRESCCFGSTTNSLLFHAANYYMKEQKRPNSSPDYRVSRNPPQFLWFRTRLSSKPPSAATAFLSRSSTFLSPRWSSPLCPLQLSSPSPLPYVAVFSTVADNPTKTTAGTPVDHI